MAASPLLTPEIYDVVILVGMASPGIAKVSGFKRAVDWDVKKGKGSKGATITANGEPPVKGTVSLQLWENDHFLQWEAYRAILRTGQNTGKKPTALDVVNPFINQQEVTAVVVGEIGIPEDQGGGLHTVEFELMEYKPAAPIGTGTPTGSAGSGAQAAGKTKDAKTAHDEEIDKLQKEISDLNKELDKELA